MFYRFRMALKSAFTILLMVPLSGCALISSQESVPVRPLKEITGSVSDALSRQAELPSCLKAKAMVQFTLKGKPQPKVRGVINWVRTEDGLKLRVTGLGPMGVTVFDCLVSQGWFYLYIPSHGVIYTANLDDAAPYGDSLNGLADDAALVLAPWSAYAKYGKEISKCPAGQVGDSSQSPLCIQFMEYGQRGVVGFDPLTLAPIYLKLHGLDVKYDAPVVLSDGSPYPTGFHLGITRLTLDIDVTLKDIEASEPSSQASLFDPSPFCQGRIVPLYVLLQGLKDSGGLM